MKMIFLVLAFLLGSVASNGQQKIVTGFILKSLEIGANNYLDFFLLAELDTSKSLEDNLVQLKSDTLLRVNLRT